MVRLIGIETQEELDQLILSIDWEEAFVRETYVVSSSYIIKSDNSVVAPHSKPDLWLLILTPENIGSKGIELNFRGVGKLGFYFARPIKLVGNVSKYNTSIDIGFHGKLGDVLADECSYRLLDKDDKLGGNHLYGNYKFST